MAAKFNRNKAMAEAEVWRHLPSADITLSIQVMVWGNRVASDTKTQFMLRVQGAKDHLRKSWTLLPANQRFRLDDFDYHALKPPVVGYFASAPGDHFYNNLFFERFEYFHDTALLHSEFTKWSTAEKQEFLWNKADKIGCKDFYDDISGLMYGFMAVVDHFSRYRFFERGGKRFCGRLEYAPGFNPFPNLGSTSGAIVYIRDTLSVALIKAEYESAEEIIKTQGGWVYNSARAFQENWDNNKVKRTPSTPLLANTDPEVKDVTHTACLMEGLFNQWYSGLAKMKQLLKIEFLEYYLFIPDWDKKYRPLAESKEEQSVSLEQLKQAILDYEVPTWLTVGVNDTRAAEMALELANRFIAYCSYSTNGEA